MTSGCAPPRRVLFVTGARDVYGGERSLLAVVRHFDSSWQPEFLVERAGALEALLKNAGYRTHRLSIAASGSRRLALARQLRLARLVYVINSRRIELVHVNLHFHAPMVAAACSVARVPVVVHVRNMIDGPAAPAFLGYDGIICISEAVRHSLVGEGEALMPELAERLWIIPDGRDLAPFSAGNGARVRREFGIDADAPLVGMAARITPMKGQDVFLRMAAAIKGRVPEVRFLLVGATSGANSERYERHLHQLAAELGLQHHVIFAGYRDDMPDVLAAMDCFAHPSRRGAFVSVLIEAMASGVPLVVSDVDGIPECVGRDGAAVLLPPDHPAAWAEAVIGILRDKRVATGMAERGRARAARLFEVGPLARRTAEVLDTVYAGRVAFTSSTSPSKRC